jgi:hypothetical protein
VIGRRKNTELTKKNVIVQRELFSSTIHQQSNKSLRLLPRLLLHSLLCFFNLGFKKKKNDWLNDKLIHYFEAKYLPLRWKISYF